MGSPTTDNPNPSSGSDNNGRQPSGASSRRSTNIGLVIALSICGTVLICVALVLLRFFYKQRNCNGVLNRDLSKSPESFMGPKTVDRATPSSSLTTIEPFLLTKTKPVLPPEKLVSSHVPPPNPASTVAPSSYTLPSTLVQLTDHTPESPNDDCTASQAGPSPRARRSFVPVRAETLAHDDV